MKYCSKKNKDSSFVVFGTRSFRKKRFQKKLNTESLLTLQFIMAVGLQNGPSWVTTSFVWRILGLFGAKRTRKRLRSPAQGYTTCTKSFSRSKLPKGHASTFFGGIIHTFHIHLSKRSDFHIVFWKIIHTFHVQNPPKVIFSDSGRNHWEVSRSFPPRK